MRVGRLVDDGRVRLVIDSLDGYRDVASLPDRAHATDVIAIIAEPLTDSELVAIGELAPLEGPFEWLPPIAHPPKNVICVGRNYAAHVLESAAARSAAPQVPTAPVFFTKPHTCLTGSGTPVTFDQLLTAEVDYEGELACVIGRTCRNVAPEKALDHVFGYSIINDVTARDLQRAHVQWFLGKSLDGFAPMGPLITTADEISDPQQLRIRTRVNGDLRQDASTSEMIFPVATLIAALSRVLTLEPGDIIATGTPEGTGQGFSPPRFLGDGDSVSVEIDRLGTLETPFRVMKSP